MILVKSQVFCPGMVDLSVYGNGAADKNDSNYKLGHNQAATLLVISYKNTGKIMRPGLFSDHFFGYRVLQDQGLLQVFSCQLLFF